MDKCKYIHDTFKVAVCRDFIKGKCNKEDCLLSHNIDSGKMPECYYFKRGICYSTKCPYSHVHVNPNALVCDEFAKGYCPLGDKCKFKHISANPKKQKTKVICSDKIEVIIEPTETPLQVTVNDPKSLHPQFTN